MKAHLLNRKTHYWLAVVIALPALVMLSSGLLLQLKKQLTWVQPPEQRGTGKVPAVTFPRVLEMCRTVPQAGVRDWWDINRLVVRLSRGLVKVWTRATGRSR